MKDNGREIFLMVKVMKHGQDLVQLPHIKVNMLLVKNMVREDISMEMNGNTKVNFQTMN